MTSKWWDVLIVTLALLCIAGVWVMAAAIMAEG